MGFASAISGNCCRRPPDDPVYKQLPGQFRAELHDRFMSPIYPFAFAALTFAFLGAPRTTRQSRNFSIGGSILAVFGLRMAGFACSVLAVKSPFAPIVQYLMLVTAIGAGLWIIVGGVVLEPPAALIEAINQIERASSAAVRAACSQHEHDDQHAWAIFRRPLRDLGARRVR